MPTLLDHSAQEHCERTSEDRDYTRSTLDSTVVRESKRSYPKGLVTPALICELLAHPTFALFHLGKEEVMG